MTTSSESASPGDKPDPAAETKKRARARSERAKTQTRKQTKEQKTREDYAKFFGIDPEGKNDQEIDRDLDRATLELARMGTRMIFSMIAGSVGKVAMKAAETGRISAQEAQEYVDAASPSDAEIDTGASAMATVTRKWAPVWIKWAPELMLAVTFGGFFITRKQMVSAIVSRANAADSPPEA